MTPEELLWRRGPRELLAGGALPGSRGRWLTAVALGAVGRYSDAAEQVRGERGGAHQGSLALSLLASHARQTGRHQQASEWDRAALAAAVNSEQLADATAGLVADSVGQGQNGAARARLQAARLAAADAGWRAQVRLAWVEAELALLEGGGSAPQHVDPRERPAAAEDQEGSARAASAERPAAGEDQGGSAELPAAARFAQAALSAARAARAPRHVAKSLLICGVARGTAGDGDLRQALHLATSLGLPTLVWPAALALADRGHPTAGQAARALQTVLAGLAAPYAQLFAARPEVWRFLPEGYTCGLLLPMYRGERPPTSATPSPRLDGARGGQV